MTLLVNN